MAGESLGFIFLNAAVINNFVLAMFLGICPFLGVSAKRDTAWNMGLAVIFVMLVSSTCAYGINQLLTAIDARSVLLQARIELGYLLDDPTVFPTAAEPTGEDS